MKLLSTILNLFLICSATVCAESFKPEHPLTLWYTNPACDWQEWSLPIGNGQFGASLYGQPDKDELQFNEKTLWTGRMTDMQGGGKGYGRYMNFGSVFVEDLNNQTDTSAYVRWLDIENGTAGVRYNRGTSMYEREYFASNPLGAVVARYKVEGGQKLNLRISMAPGRNLNASEVVYKQDMASFCGKLDVVSYNAGLSVKAIGRRARVKTTPAGYEIKNADEVIIVLSGVTDFDSSSPDFTSGTEQIGNIVKQRLYSALAKDYQTLRTEHTRDFESYMSRCRLQLTADEVEIPTNKLIDLYNSAECPENYTRFLEQLYFAYGRYLEISSSRGVDSPANLQGIWCKDSDEFIAWNSDIHSNINVQMNYWPAEPTNLSEIHFPFLNYIIGMSKRDNWKKAATEAGQTKGWSCYTENNIFGGMSRWGDNYLVANAWYCSHLWQHYRYTLDKDFLLRAFPTMWSAAEFWMERMIEDRVIKDGSLICPDEYSPEQNAPGGLIIEDATAHSQQLMVELFTSVRQAISILGTKNCNLSEKDVADLEKTLSKLDNGLHIETFQGGEWTSWAEKCGITEGDELLKEWKYSPYTISYDKGHRHLSHLMALYPFSQIMPESRYFRAAVNSLKLRGDEATGWSMGWKINLWARAQEGNHAYVILRNALRHAGENGGVYYNLYDAHPPFQIDGNFGVCAGIAEMLMQSYNGEIRILPALPSAWNSGSIRGMKAEGDFTVDIEWKDAKVNFVRIVANQGGLLKLRCNGVVEKRETYPGEVITFSY